MKKTPTVVSFDITFRCNLKCVMCHTWQKGNEIELDRELSSAEIISAARHLFDTLGVTTFRFLGGEPLVRSDLAQIVQGISPFATTLVTTNGLLLNESRCKALIESGLAGISVSVDGPRENCDAVRGKGAYDRAIRGLKTLIRVRGELGSKIKVKVGNVVTKLNLLHMEDAAKFANELGVDWDLWPMIHLYEAAMGTEWNGISARYEHPDPVLASQLVLDSADLKMFWKELYRLARYYGAPGSRKRIQGWLGPVKQIAVHKAFAPVLFKDCQRIGQHMIVNPGGEILPCEFLRPVSLGNVRNRDQEIWRTPTRIALEKVARERSLPVCQECHRLDLYRRHF